MQIMYQNKLYYSNKKREKLENNIWNSEIDIDPKFIIEKSEVSTKWKTKVFQSPSRKLTGFPVYMEPKLIVPILSSNKKTPSTENFSNIWESLKCKWFFNSINKAVV